VARTRDYKAEYKRRKAQGLARGLTLSQARGHPKARELSASGKAVSAAADARIQSAISAMGDGQSLTRAAKTYKVSAERLKRTVQAKGLGSKINNRWVLTDQRPRRVPLISKDAQTIAVTVAGFPEASRVGVYFDRVGKFVLTQDTSLLDEFDGEAVRDVHGNDHPLITDPNTLIRHVQKDEPSFPEIYRLLDPVEGAG
tara:strand:- start:239 stop:835 length:597 start_codon:yes stop_codon:yes gene_type:complete